MSQNKGNGHGKPDSHGKNVHHIVPFKVYYLVWIGLIIGTILTVLTSYMDFGEMNLFIAMFIATVKALLVMLFFMGLKYDGYENNVTFFASFAFLAVFMILTAADIFNRVEEFPVRVDVAELPASGEPVDFSKYLKPTPELLQKGKAMFTQQCVMCHGAEGKGDGPASAALNPKPRNFTSGDGWKNGRNLSKVFTTITTGLAGTPMPPFGTLAAEDRMALAHFVRSLGPNAPAESAEDLNALQALNKKPAKARLPIKVALEKVAVPSQSVRPELGLDGRVTAVPGAMAAAGEEDESHGRGIYQRQCMGCHAGDGRGGVAVQSIGVNPPLRFVTSQLHSNALASLSDFQRAVSQGLPGRGMPGFATFSASQWQELYSYVKSLH